MFSIPILAGLVSCSFFLLRRVNQHRCHLAAFQRCLEWLHVWRSNKYPEWTERRFANLLTRATISLLSSGYTVLSWYSLTIFDCIHLRGHTYVREDVAIECYSKEWGGYVPTSLLGILAYVIGTPLGFLWLLRRQRFGDLPNSLEVLGYQFMMYRKEYRWVPVADLIWRLSLVVVVRLGRPQVLQVTILMVLLLSRAVFHAWKRPIVKSMKVASQEIILGTCTLLICIVGAIFYGQQSNISRGSERALFGIVLTLLMVMCGCSVWMTVNVVNASKEDRRGERSVSSSSVRSSMAPERIDLPTWQRSEAGSHRSSSLDLCSDTEGVPAMVSLSQYASTKATEDRTQHESDNMALSSRMLEFNKPLLDAERRASS